MKNKNPVGHIMKLIEVLKRIESIVEDWRKRRNSGVLTFRLSISKGGIRDMEIEKKYNINQG